MMPTSNQTSKPAPVWASMIATFFGIGRLRPGPGSWGSAATILLWWLASSRIAANWHVATVIAVAAGVVIVGIPSATLVSRASGLKDPQFVVIDEVAGQLITLIGVPLSWKSVLLGFILFRGFDITKPPPVRKIEHLPGGFGIILDDVAAGLYALAIMQILVRARLLSP